jgi:2-hydroxy-3-keto-5-methylthiopentenyl-1-phosphate phosphatase
MKNNIIVFVDFDGTITKDDVGEAIFREFGDQERVDKIIEDLMSDQITAKECWIRLFDTFIDFDRKKLDDFIDSFQIDESFHSFVSFCKKNELEIYVLSDGFDYYINKIFERENLTGLKVFCNNLSITADNQFILNFPYGSPDCPSSANCKRNHIINNSSDDDFTLFVGDGNSDKYTVQFCDYIFAKDSLLKFCEKERITFFPYKSFADVEKKTEELVNKKRLKKRHQAELKRKEVYIQE